MTDDQTADTIIPDGKDWTWVLDHPCPECGFVSNTIDRSDLGDLIRANTAEWAGLLEAPTAELRRRTRPDRWSTLEYAAHVRDVFRLYEERLRLMLAMDDPLFANWDQDATAIECRYNESDPEAVSRELVEAGQGLAAEFDRVADDDWQRDGRRSDGAAFTVESFGRYLLHDPVHHVWDVSRS